LLIDNDIIDFKYIKEENPYPNINNINILLPTVNSKIIKCDYRIQVSLYFDNFVTSGYRPRVKLPIIITHFIEEEGNNNIKQNYYVNNNYYNYNRNLIDSNDNINSSSMVYDQKFINNNINNDNNINIESINDTEKDNMNNELSEYIKSNKFINQITSCDDKNNNNKANYIELKKEFYNINEI
jgi:hypothetical protein